MALAADGRREEALPELERGVFLRRLWAQPLDLADGLIALGAVRRASAARRCSTKRRRCWRAAPTRACCPRAWRPRDARRRAPEPLTERELTVLRFLSSGLSEREIGRELFLSFNTVHSHVKSLYRKLGVSSRAEAVARARDFT